jgi:hypothetical protein
MPKISYFWCFSEFFGTKHDITRARETDVAATQQHPSDMAVDIPVSQSSTESQTPFKLKTLNLKQNDPWGPRLSKTKPDHTFRECQNINGLCLGHNGLNILDYFCHMRTIVGANILGASEINVEASHLFVQLFVHQHRNQARDHSRFQLLSSKIYFNSIYFNSTRKPGGTLIGITGNATGLLEEQFSDPMGQFCSLKLLGRLGKRTTIMSVYQVPKNCGSRSKTTSHQQKVLHLKKDGKSNQHPRKDFCVNLDHISDNKINACHQIILGGDFK